MCDGKIKAHTLKFNELMSLSSVITYHTSRSKQQQEKSMNSTSSSSSSNITRNATIPRTIKEVDYNCIQLPGCKPWPNDEVDRFFIAANEVGFNAGPIFRKNVKSYAEPTIRARIKHLISTKVVDPNDETIEYRTPGMSRALGMMNASASNVQQPPPLKRQRVDEQQATSSVVTNPAIQIPEEEEIETDISEDAVSTNWSAATTSKESSAVVESSLPSTTMATSSGSTNVLDFDFEGARGQTVFKFFHGEEMMKIDIFDMGTYVVITIPRLCKGLSHRYAVRRLDMTIMFNPRAEFCTGEVRVKFPCELGNNSAAKYDTRSVMYECLKINKTVDEFVVC